MHKSYRARVILSSIFRLLDVWNPQIVNWLLADCRCLEPRHFRNLTKQPETENSDHFKIKAFSPNCLYYLIKKSQTSIFISSGNAYCILIVCMVACDGESTKEELEKGGVGRDWREGIVHWLSSCTCSILWSSYT